MHIYLCVLTIFSLSMCNNVTIYFLFFSTAVLIKCCVNYSKMRHFIGIYLVVLSIELLIIYIYVIIYIFIILGINNYNIHVLEFKIVR